MSLEFLTILFAFYILHLFCCCMTTTNAAIITSIGTLSQTTTNGLQCQRIAVSACQGLGYNMTALPNLAGHTNQLEAELKIAKLLPLIESGCSNRARFLLCSSLFPLCTPDVPRPITACKSLCETVKMECINNANAELMELWPDFLICETLPQPENHELCMQIPQEAVLKMPPLDAIQQQQQQELQEPIKLPQPQQLDATSAASATQQQQQQQAGTAGTSSQHYWSWIAWKMPAHLTKTISSNVHCPQNFTVNPLNASECVAQCHSDAFHTTAQKKHTESLILGMSAVCFVLTLFALVTFWAEPTRFGYPERPVLFLCLCYNLFSICYLERIVFHNSTRTLERLASKINPLPCTLTPPCLASYITTSYLSLCAATWWLIFALCFYLSSHKKWSSEALEKRAGLFHVLAWVPPLTPPIAALLLDRVRPNELTGMCTAPGFVELPTLALLSLGIFFTLRASRSLHTLQQQMQLTLGAQRFSQIRKRFLIFSLLYFVPTAASVVSTYTEHYAAAVPSCATPGVCTMPAPLSAWPTLVRIFFQLAGGTLTGMWVWSRKTCESYRNRLVAGTPAATHAASSKKQIYACGKTLASGGPPLYAGISFHNVPAVYQPNQSRV